MPGSEVNASTINSLLQANNPLQKISKMAHSITRYQDNSPNECLPLDDQRLTSDRLSLTNSQE